MSYTSEKVERVLEALQREQTRCTYGALAEFIGASPRDVSAFLSPKRPEASWVVNKKTSMPTGYESFQIHPELQTHEKVIEQGTTLNACSPVKATCVFSQDRPITVALQSAPSARRQKLHPVDSVESHTI